MWLPSLPALLLGCAVPPLPDAPITGGDPEQRAAVREVLQAFDHDIGEGRIGIRGVEFAPHLFPGAYSRLTHRITLKPDLAPDEIPTVLRHELCHVLDFAEGLVADPGGPWDAVAQDLSASDLVVDEPYPTDRIRRAEAMAAFCSLGPWVAGLAADSCPGDPPEAEALGEWLDEVVWIGAPAPERTPPIEVAGAWDAGLVPDHLGIDPTGSTGVVQIRATSGANAAWAAVELRGGAEVPLYDLGSVSQDEGLVPPGCPGELLAEQVGWDEGPAAAVDQVGLFHLGAMERLLAYDGAWSVAGDGCVPEVSELFPADGRVWLGWAEGRTVLWGEVAE